MKTKRKRRKQKTAFITGITGQDGSYLAEFLLDKGYEVHGLVRRSSTDPLMRIEHLALSRKIKLHYGNLRDIATLRWALEEAKPDEIYNLAAQSDVGISFRCPDETMETNYHGVGRLINEALRLNPDVRIYQASTSEMFGRTPPRQNERSPFNPVSPYGEAKMRAHCDFIEGYRKRYGSYTCSGILFNHESPRRGEHFVTRKITISLAKIKLGLQDSFELGNINAQRDWGFAGDYVKAMWMMLQQDKADDYVVASGKSHTVRDFANAAAAAFDMKITWNGKGLREVGRDKNGKIIIRINKRFYRPTDVHYLEGDMRKAKRKLKWEPETSFDELVEMMARSDYNHFSKRI